ncbi:MAG: class Ib ribonucleoside-diphosphate reductase assembly flavoprotein NrdI [Lactobacillaceae bacterium]|jgi:protein involved in ribonucleotide reduction|nr:class Ib ribonucleoside-diphosphate reductase assembly flavoprotein NrdI [Lactobacillaceae bacterium]
MPKTFRLLYISVSGNTRHFVENLVNYVVDNSVDFIIEPVEVSDGSLDRIETEPFFAAVPTYLDGGNGIDNGVKEILTNALFDQIDYLDSPQNLIGVIGSGNKNFNAQYVLTAKRYAETFNAPLIGDYELRGTQADVKRIYEALVETVKDYL